MEAKCTILNDPYMEGYIWFLAVQKERAIVLNLRPREGRQGGFGGAAICIDHFAFLLLQIKPDHMLGAFGIVEMGLNNILLDGVVSPYTHPSASITYISSIRLSLPLTLSFEIRITVAHEINSTTPSLNLLKNEARSIASLGRIEPCFSGTTSDKIFFLIADISPSLNQNGREFLIQANTQKRRKLEDDNSSTSFEHVETAADTVKKIVDNTDTSKVGSDVNRRKQSRVKGQTNSGRGRGSRVSDQTKSQAVSVSNGQLENSYQKLQDGLPKEQIGHDRQTVFEEEITSLRAKVVALEEELKKSRQEASDYQHQCQQLEKELKDLKDYEQQTKPKVCFISCFTSFGW
uniref:Uncharacterized protein n=1 Tax=Nicotiana tabacum TaxID=4097 RepID=A0A1S4C626_TOBAC|nr:PREDICTED: uncharacterized protein LOC107815566 [Nicotiana tabacum]